MTIFRDKGQRELRLTQAQYIEIVLSRFGVKKYVSGKNVTNT